MTEFKLPELGENVHQGDLVRLMIAPGATIAEGQAVMELETDKAVVEVPSSVRGTIKDDLVKKGENIKNRQVIFTVENGAGAKHAEARTATAPSAKGEAKPAAAAPVAESSPVKAVPQAAPVAQAAKTSAAVVPS